MQTLRTPDDRFADLPDFAYAPHYVDITDDIDATALRVHYLDEGPVDAAPILLMHGEPTWSFLYRHMIPVLVARGHRCIAPDLVGFGRSDKPTQRGDYTYARHVAWMRAALFDQLDLHDLTFVGQDWGGLIGLRLVAEHSERFSRVVVGNTFLPTGTASPSDAFLAWQKYSQATPVFAIGNIVNGGCTTDLTADVIAGYDAPFPDDTFKAGARVFPTLVPTRPDDPAVAANVAAWDSLGRFSKPWLCAFSDRDQVTKGCDEPFLRAVPGAVGQPHTTVEGAGHFLQEDAGPQLAGIVADFIQTTSDEPRTTNG